MPVSVSTIDTTVGGSSSNAYVTLAVANQYNTDRAPSSVGTTWTAANDEQRSAAIIDATRQLDALVEWTGWAVDADQALLWPRSGMWDRAGYSVLSTVIPTELQEATAEYARQLLAKDRMADSDPETEGIQSIKAGSVAITFKSDVSRKVVPDAVVNLLPVGWFSHIRGRDNANIDLVRA